MKAGALCAVGSFLLAQHALCHAWTIPDQPLRLNVGVLRSGSVQLLSQAKPGIVDLLPNIGGHDLTASQKNELHAFGNEPRRIDWGAVDSGNTPQVYMLAAPFCSVPDETKLTTRAGAWEAAYGCLKGLATSSTPAGTPFVTEFVGPGSTIYAVEPVLDLIDEERVKKQVFLNENAPAPEAAETPVTAASRVWPTGAPGWHLGDQYSQLGSAYHAVFARGLDTQGTVVVAHLDTGYFSEDAVRPKYLDFNLSKTCTQSGCTQGGEANWGAKGFMSSPGHGTGTLSNLAGNSHIGANPSAHVYSINIHDSVIHLDSRRMATGIEAAVTDKADLITLSHGGLPSLRLASAVDNAYSSGTPIFAATGDFFELPLFLGRTFRSVVYPARYSQVMGVAGVTKDGRSYGENPSILWWLSFGPGYFSRIGSWMLRGNFGPTSVMSEGNIISSYVPNITRSEAEFGKNSGLGNNGAGTSHATPQVAAAASLWLEKNKANFGDKWRSWEKSEAVYQALSQSASACFADYNIEHYGRGILKAQNALDWVYSPSGNSAGSVTGPNARSVTLTRKEAADLDLPGVIELFRSVQLPGQYKQNVQEAFANALATELSQLVFTSEKLQKYLQKFHICAPSSNGCDKCVRQDLPLSHWLDLARLVNGLPEASPTLKQAMLEISKQR